MAKSSNKTKKWQARATRYFASILPAKKNKNVAKHSNGRFSTVAELEAHRIKVTQK